MDNGGQDRHHVKQRYYCRNRGGHPHDTLRPLCAISAPRLFSPTLKYLRGYVAEVNPLVPVAPVAPETKVVVPR